MQSDVALNKINSFCQTNKMFYASSIRPHRCCFLKLLLIWAELTACFNQKQVRHDLLVVSLILLQSLIIQNFENIFCCLFLKIFFFSFIAWDICWCLQKVDRKGCHLWISSLWLNEFLNNKYTWKQHIFMWCFHCDYYQLLLSILFQLL